MYLAAQDYADLLQTHRSNNADITIATHAVGFGQASFRGCCKVEPDTGDLHLVMFVFSGPHAKTLICASRNHVFLTSPVLAFESLPAHVTIASFWRSGVCTSMHLSPSQGLSLTSVRLYRAVEHVQQVIG